MTPASTEKRLAGKWIVWWRHELHTVVDTDGRVTKSVWRRIWRYGHASKRVKSMIHTAEHDRIEIENAFVVDEIPDWPIFSDGHLRSLTHDEFCKLTRCQP